MPRLTSGRMLSAMLIPMLAGCTSDTLSFLDPQGPIAAAQRDHFFAVIGLLMIVVLPVLVLTPVFAWRYRRKNAKSRYTPKWNFSRPLEIAIWGVPVAVVAILAVLLVRSTAALDPYAADAGGSAAAARSQVVGLDWKWLFIYPDQGIASVGELAFPADRPLALELTSDSVMQSFFIPALGSQIYAMAGMVTKLHLAAFAPGRFLGENSQFNGMGFQRQKFAAVALPPGDFANWVETVKASGIPLDRAMYRQLAEKSTPQSAYRRLGTAAMPRGVLYFNTAPAGLFGSIVDKYRYSASPAARRIDKASAPGVANAGHAGRGASMTTIDWTHLLLGRLSWDALPFWEMIRHPTFSNLVNGVDRHRRRGGRGHRRDRVTVLITRYGLWRSLWSEWLTSVDHKRIGIMYVVLSFVMLARAVIEAVLMRTQQAFGLGGGFLSPDHFSQLFTTHGSIMIFFMAMPFLTGLINYVVPLQIGARDVSFPVMNSISLGLTAAGAALAMVSLVLGKFSTGGWSGYPPYTEIAFNPGVGPDYWIWAVTLSSIGTTMTGINFAVTIYKERSPGMTLLPDAAVLLDRAVHQHPDDFRHAAADRRHPFARPRPLPRLPFLHQRARRQHDELCQPVLAVRSSRGLHPDPARLRHLLGGVLDVLGEGSVWVQVAGLRDDGDRGPLLHRLGASLLHHGPERPHQRRLRHR